METSDYLAAVGGFASRAALLEAGVSYSRIRADLLARRIISPRYGWFASIGADPDVLRAVRAGGRLACASALRHHGIWTLADRRLHVACAPGKGSRHPDVRVHTGKLRSHGMHPTVESPLEALERFSRCGSRVAFVAAADSALNRGLIALPQLRAAVAVSIASLRLMDGVDGRSESGTESLARLALRAHRIRFTPQVVIPRVGRVDLLVGDRLIIEMDSWRWHSTPDAFENDRRRDLAAAARGYLPVRVTYARALNDWPSVQDELVGIVRAGAHLWSASTKRLSRNHGL